ncbi:hypothetical protein L356_07097 [Enterobacter sp. MGH 10]|nr:hypothetical protein L356_07097 [Enterobacter sp. MGH 10]
MITITALTGIIIYFVFSGLTYARKKKSHGNVRGSFILAARQFNFHSFGFQQRFN